MTCTIESTVDILDRGWMTETALTGVALAVVLICGGASPAESAQDRLQMSAPVRQRCLEVLRFGLQSDAFWPSLQAAEALTLAGFAGEVRSALEPKLGGETDDQRRCVLAREIARAGDLRRVEVLLNVLGDPESNGHVHAAESLYRITRIGDGRLLRKRFRETNDKELKVMTAAALGRCGSPAAMQYLREALTDGNIKAAMWAAWALGHIGDITDISVLRSNQSRVDEPLARSFFEHSLATLGDSQGQRTLIRNLSSENAEIRGYACTVAGEARMFQATDRLMELLDDPVLDVRIRAAQSLLMLQQALPQNPWEDVSLLVYEATTEHPRYSEGSVIELNDGEFLYATTEFSGSSSDFARARIIGRTSSDGGRTWGPIRELQENVGRMNVLGTTLRRLPPGTFSSPIGMMYSVTGGYDKIRVYLKVSQDETQTFGEPVLVSDYPGYNMVLADKMITLRNGRLLVPNSWAADIVKDGHITSFGFLSDDGGRTWRRGKGNNVDLPKRGAMEPDVVELRDGRVMMILRTQLGYIAKSYSQDGGETWSEPTRLGELKAPEAPGED